MSREAALVVGGAVVVTIIWLLFAHWQVGVSVLLFLILVNQGAHRG